MSYVRDLSFTKGNSAYNAFGGEILGICDDLYDSLENGAITEFGDSEHAASYSHQHQRRHLSCDATMGTSFQEQEQELAGLAARARAG